MDLAPPPEDGAEQDAGQFWTDFVIETAPEFRKPTIEQLATFIEPVWASLLDGAVYCEPQLRAILDRAQPDVIVEDNVNGVPGAPHPRRAVGEDHELQPARDEGSGPSADVQRVSGERPGRVGRVPRGVRADPPSDLGALQRVHDRQRRARRFPTSSSSTSPSSMNLYVYPGGRRLPAVPAALAPRGTGSIRPSARPRSLGRSPTSSARAPVRSSTSRSARWAPPTST